MSGTSNACHENGSVSVPGHTGYLSSNIAKTTGIGSSGTKYTFYYVTVCSLLNGQRLGEVWALAKEPCVKIGVKRIC